MGRVLHDLERGDVVLVDFTEYYRFGEHPAVIIEIDDELVTYDITIEWNLLKFYWV